jgi:CubicO group peptidase (beta-lactamase class C family)
VSRQRALNYPPGAEYSYSNTGFSLAAIMVGRVSGKPFPDFTREAIFNPLDMSSTQWRDDFQRIVRNRVIAYSQNGGITRTLMPFENVYGNGGLLTTVGDLLRWNQNFTTAKVGGRALVEAQHQQGKLNDGRTIAYAAGLMVLNWKGLREVAIAVARQVIALGSAATRTKGFPSPFCAISHQQMRRSLAIRWPTSI